VTTLDIERAAKVEALCEQIVPGSSVVGPAVYVDAVLSGMSTAMRDFALHAFEMLASAESLEKLLGTPEFACVRALAIEAYYSDFVAPGRDAPGAYADIDFNTPLATRIRKDWSFLGIA
jgi:hypothetical protein